MRANLNPVYRQSEPTRFSLLFLKSCLSDLILIFYKKKYFIITCQQPEFLTSLTVRILLAHILGVLLITIEAIYLLSIW